MLTYIYWLIVLIALLVIGAVILIYGSDHDDYRNILTNIGFVIIAISVIAIFADIVLITEHAILH